MKQRLLFRRRAGSRQWALVGALLAGGVPLGIAPALAESATAAQLPMLTPREATTTIDGVKFHYFVYGDLKSVRLPLIILHGAYMSSDGMRGFAQNFAKTRPVIVLDQRGHGRTGDVPGPITYERLADDAATVLKAAGVNCADVFGFSIGGAAAVQLAIRHPNLIAHLVEVSGAYNSTATYGAEPNVTAAMFAGTPIEREYKRLAPDPTKFPTLIDKINALSTAPHDWPTSAVRAIRAKTMIISGDDDIIRPEHSVDLFRLRGGAPAELAGQGFVSAPPNARLAILPATGHLNIVAQPDLIVAMVVPFLDDAAPEAPKGFF